MINLNLRKENKAMNAIQRVLTHKRLTAPQIKITFQQLETFDAPQYCVELESAEGFEINVSAVTLEQAMTLFSCACVDALRDLEG